MDDAGGLIVGILAIMLVVAVVAAIIAMATMIISALAGAGGLFGAGTALRNYITAFRRNVSFERVPA
jgi:hypothetical protein